MNSIGNVECYRNTEAFHYIDNMATTLNSL